MVLKVDRVERMNATARIMLSVDQAVVALGLSRAEIYNLMASGDLAYVQVGRRRLVAMDDLRAFVQRHRVAEKYAEQKPPRTTRSKGSAAQRERRELERRYAQAEKYGERARRQSVPASETSA